MPVDVGDKRRAGEGEILRRELGLDSRYVYNKRDCRRVARTDIKRSLYNRLTLNTSE